MATASLPPAKERGASAERSLPPRLSPAPVERVGSPILGLQHAAGNWAMGRLLLGGLLQPELRTASGLGAPEAGAVADAGGQLHQPLLQRASEESGEALIRGEGEPTRGPEEGLPTRREPGSGKTAAEGEAVALVVGDEAETIGPGQMRKSRFFARLRTEVCAAAEAGLAGTGHSAQGCPLIEFWLGHYQNQDVERINRDLPRFAGDGPRPASAEEFIALAAARVRTSVVTWAQTGELTGVPAGIPLPGMGLPGLGGFGGVLGRLGSVLFRAKPGGARDPGDPAALQVRLGAGRPLDGSIRSRMESAFGRGFSQVRVHDDGGAAGLATSLNAKAFTVGEHVAFGAREYRPGTLAGDALIAHELAHVAQQSDGGTTTASAGVDRLEADADLAGASATVRLWGGLRALPRPEPRLRSGLRLQRCGGCSGKKAAATTRGAARPPAACEPTPVGLDILQDEAPFGNNVTLGYTRLAPTSRHDCTPMFAPGDTPGTCTFTPRPVGLELTSKSVKPGEYTNPKQRTKSVEGCGEIPLVLDVREPIPELAREGEKEHCNDIRLAYVRTIEPCSEALARFAGTPLTGGNAQECMGDLVQKLGFDPRSCSREFSRLLGVSKERDDQNWHTFEPYDWAPDCGRVFQRWRRGRDNRIDDQVPSTAVVPAATGCSSPAASPASPPPAPPATGTP